MTALYFDTNVGLLENTQEWTAEDEGKSGILSFLAKLFK